MRNCDCTSEGSSSRIVVIVPRRVVVRKIRIVVIVPRMVVLRKRK